MNGYLLDTHRKLRLRRYWFLTDDSSLSPAAERIIRDGVNRVCVSIISAWELAIKISIGKLRFPGNAAGFIKAVQDNEIDIIPIKSAHLTVFESLPVIHRDPFDRLLVATAVSEQMILIAADANIARYDVSHIW